MTQDQVCNKIKLKICNQRGLHARASAKFVKCAEQFPNTHIIVEKDGMEVSAVSIMGLMMLAAAKNTTINISATGENVHDALQALTDLVNNKFNEEI